MDEFRTLLNRFWVRRSEDRELFYQLRRKLPAMRGVLREQFGWEVTCTEEVIRLVKQPAKASPAFGIRSFTAVGDYSLLLVRVLQYAEQIGLVRSCEGESERFAAHQEQEVLYENTGLSRFFSINFHRDISSYQSVQDFEQPPGDTPDQERGLFRTYRVFRQLALAPAAYWDDPADSVYAYIKNQRGSIQRVLDQTIGGKLQVYHNGAFFLPEEGVACGDLFPRDQMLSDVLLLLFEQLDEKIQRGDYSLTPDDRVLLSRDVLCSELDACRKQFCDQWGKTFAEKELSALAQEVIDEMVYWDFATEQDGMIILNPTTSLWQGVYPNNRRNNHG